MTATAERIKKIQSAIHTIKQHPENYKFGDVIIRQLEEKERVLTLQLLENGKI